jgi:hypothetical protein
MHNICSGMSILLSCAWGKICYWRNIGFLPHTVYLVSANAAGSVFIILSAGSTTVLWGRFCHVQDEARRKTHESSCPRNISSVYHLIYLHVEVTWWHSWLRHCVTSWKDVISIPGGITNICHLLNPSDCTSGRDVKLAARLHLTSNLRINGAVPPLLLPGVVLNQMEGIYSFFHFRRSCWILFTSVSIKKKIFQNEGLNVGYI